MSWKEGGWIKVFMSNEATGSLSLTENHPICLYLPFFKHGSYY